MPRALGEILRDGCFADIGKPRAGGAQPEPEIPNHTQQSVANYSAVTATLKMPEIEINVLAERPGRQAPHDPAFIQ